MYQKGVIKLVQSKE